VAEAERSPVARAALRGAFAGSIFSVGCLAVALNEHSSDHLFDLLVSAVAGLNAALVVAVVTGVELVAEKREASIRRDVVLGLVTFVVAGVGIVLASVQGVYCLELARSSPHHALSMAARHLERLLHGRDIEFVLAFAIPFPVAAIARARWLPLLVACVLVPLVSTLAVWPLVNPADRSIVMALVGAGALALVLGARLGESLERRLFAPGSPS